MKQKVITEGRYNGAMCVLLCGTYCGREWCDVCTVVWHILWQGMVGCVYCCVAHTVAGNGAMCVLFFGGCLGGDTAWIGRVIGYCHFPEGSSGMSVVIY